MWPRSFLSLIFSKAEQAIYQAENCAHGLRHEPRSGSPALCTDPAVSPEVTVTPGTAPSRLGAGIYSQPSVAQAFRQEDVQPAPRL